MSDKGSGMAYGSRSRLMGKGPVRNEEVLMFGVEICGNGSYGAGRDMELLRTLLVLT